jgi:hypothetical protein
MDRYPWLEKMRSDQSTKIFLFLLMKSSILLKSIDINIVYNTAVLF